jgi:hypothetical protein
MLGAAGERASCGEGSDARERAGTGVKEILGLFMPDPPTSLYGHLHSAFSSGGAAAAVSCTAQSMPKTAAYGTATALPLAATGSIVLCPDHVPNGNKIVEIEFSLGIRIFV